MTCGCFGLGMSARLKAALVAVVLWLPAAQRPDAVRYLNEPAFRRAALVASLTSAQNGYATLRLGHYATVPRPTGTSGQSGTPPPSQSRPAMTPRIR